MAQGLKSFTIDAGDVSFILNQVKFATIKVIGYDASGAPLYGYVDASGNEHLLGLAGTFDPTSVIYFNSTDPSDPLIGLPLYNGPRDFQGLRNVSGHFNNLINGQSSWGATGNDFLRLVSPDYTHYVQENIAANNTVSVDGFGVHHGGALQTSGTETVIDIPSGIAHTFATHNFYGVTNGVTAPADYSNPLANVVDYTPRMITQTIASKAAMDRLEAATPGFITDTFTGALTDLATGLTTPYTENFIENTNSYAADPPYSGWFVLFGQFFDHGLDFIQKPNTGPSIQIALSVDDPLYGQIGPDGRPVTSLTINRATPITGTGTGPLNPAQYQNMDSPYIDQNQTYGAIDQITLLLREWALDPNSGTYKAGAALLDGHTVQTAYLSTVFSDQGAFGAYADGQGLTDRTLPTLNELRAALAATGRDDLSWEDISNFRIRDTSGHVQDFDLGTAGVQSIGTGQALLLDMLNRFDSAHIDASPTGKLDALGATGVTIIPVSPTVNDVQFTYTDASSVVHTTTLYTPGNINPADNSIVATDANLHAILGEILLESVGDHYIAGDGRSNENFGLTTVHHVFHEDHNVQLVNLEAAVLGGQNVDPVKAHDWQVKVIGTVFTSAAGDVVANYAGYTGVSYHYQNLHTVTDSSGTYFVADLTNIRNGRGEIVMDGASPLVAVGVYVDASGHVSWNQDMMFQGAKLIVEMEYQHVAIDQYARFITPDLPEFVTYDANINAGISIEYAQAAFRFGHSQLRETIDAMETQSATDGSFDVTGAITHYALAQAFLNPAGFADVGPSAIALGMTHQVGNETDEFVTPALQQSLLGQPLDLGAINIARGRDLGIPTLNEVRKELYDALVAERANVGGPQAAAHAKIQLDLLKPYNSWSEFGNTMIHSESLVNFIAAYSFDGNLDKAKAMIGLNDGSIAEGSPEAMGYTAEQAFDFMSGSLDATTHQFLVEGAGGFNSIDLWIGGLAESHVLGGILGPTFNAIFEDQMERLMDGDRFYYLYRLFDALPQITNLSEQITNEQFKDIVERTTGVHHLNGDIMLYALDYVELGQAAVGTGLADYKTEHKYGGTFTYGAGSPTTLAAFADLHVNADGTKQGVYSSGGAGTGGNGGVITIPDSEHPGQFLTYIRDFRPDSPNFNSNGNPLFGYNSLEVLSGTQYNDYLDTGDGDDTAYGGAGNDYIIGNGGGDHLYGEAGNDIMFGGGGSAGADVADFMDGGDGDDYLYGGQNAGATEVMIGGTGNDHIYGESGIDEIAGGEGDDYIDAGGDTDLVFAGAGNDEMYGGEGPDELHGDLGDDLISGGSGTDKLLGEQGDDILYGGQGGGVSNGDSDELIGGDPSLGVASDTGFDIANYADSSIALNVAADLTKQQLVAGINGVPSQPFNHLYMGIDGIVGSKFDDKFAPSATNLSGAGLIGDDTGNWLVGGSGNDTMLGGGGNDIIVGGSIRLDKLIGTYSGGYTNDVDGATHRAIGPIGTNGFLDSAALGGQFDKHFTDLLRSEARKDYVLGDGGANGTADTAVLSGDRSNYTVVALDISGNVIADPVANIASVFAVKITDNGGGGRTILDGTDLVIGVQNFAFADGSRSLIQLFNHAPTGRVDFTAVFGPNVVGNNAQDANAVRLTGRSAIYDQDNILGSNLLGAILTSAVTFSWTDNLIVPITTVGSGTSNYVDGQGRLVLHTTGGVIVNETGSYVDAGGFSESVTTTWNMIVGTSGANAGLTGTNSAVIGDAIFGLAGTDTLNGGDGNDQLYGGSGTDTLNGGTGNDYLDGGDGGDTMVGGSGDDTYVVNSASDIVTELFNGGIDTVLASVSYTLGANVENLTLTGNNNISGTGNTLDNIIIGNSGNNTLNGGIGIDTVAYTGSVLRASFSLPGADIVVAMPANGNDTLQSIEKLMFGGDTFNLVVGSNVANGALTGGAGADLILGFGGNDTLSGNGGNDVLIGGANAAGGHDTLTGGLGADTFVFATGDSGNAALTRDVITDFAGSDRIELSLWDAISGGGANFGDQDFAVGTLPTGFLNGFHVGSFTGSGQLRYSASGADTLIEGNTNGNNANSEFHILLQGYNSLNGLHHVVDASGDYIIV